MDRVSRTSRRWKRLETSVRGVLDSLLVLVFAATPTDPEREAALDPDLEVSVEPGGVARTIDCVVVIGIVRLLSLSSP